MFWNYFYEFIISMLAVIFGTFLVYLFNSVLYKKIDKPNIIVGFVKNRSGQFLEYTNKYKIPGGISFDLAFHILAKNTLPFSRNMWNIIITLRPDGNIVSL